MGERKVQIVSHRNAESARLRDRSERGEALQLLLNIEICGRLVEKQYLGLLGEARGQQNPLPLASAQRVILTVPVAETLHPIHCLGRLTAVFVRLKPLVGIGIAAHQHNLLHGEGKLATDALRQMADDLRTLASAPLREWASFDPNRPGLRGAKARQNIEERAFPGAVQAQQRNELAATGRKSGGFEDHVRSIRERDIAGVQ